MFWGYAVTSRMSYRLANGPERSGIQMPSSTTRQSFTQSIITPLRASIPTSALKKLIDAAHQRLAHARRWLGENAKYLAGPHIGSNAPFLK